MPPPDYYDAGDMAIYDALPLVVRRALDSTIVKYKPASASDALAQGYPPDALARIILKMDAEKAHAEHAKVWGF